MRGAWLKEIIFGNQRQRRAESFSSSLSRWFWEGRAPVQRLQGERGRLDVYTEKSDMGELLKDLVAGFC